MPNAPGAVTNPFEEPERRISEYTAQEIATLQARLDKKLGPEYISSRPGAAGQKVHYLSADKCINLANEVFGFNGWSSSIQKIDIDFIEENQNTGKISLGLSVIVRVTLRDGTFHEDIGYGHIENCKGKAAAFEKSKKEGTTDALKRTLRNFGNVLGNCVYDKDYLTKVTKVKAGPGKWDVDELHRHPDFAPRKLPPPKRMAEDDDLPPPRPLEQAKSSVPEIKAAFDGDGEFGSDLFDEADFVVGNSGNPDEISLEPETSRQPPTPMNRPIPPRGPPGGRFDTNAVTPSKPERWNGPNAASRQSLPQNALPSAIPGPSRPMAAPGLPNNNPNITSAVAPQSNTVPNSNAHNPKGPQQIKREPLQAPNQDANQPPGSQSVGFFSARAADMLRDNPNAGPIQGSQFDPHAESPSIRKTAGVDHTKSVPISRPMLAGGSGSPAPNNSRDFQPTCNDESVPPGAAASPLSRGPSVSSYRPLTRPNVQSPGPPNRGGSVPPPNLNGKRPPLNDVTNATTSTGVNPAPPPGPNEPKRPRMSDGSPGLGPPQAK
ncbi:DNA repair and recombination protein radC [Penicillium maclennaniae]|uniref:DNA repair and recombination protein radC n=1 Tax=Penicillium maclennaniae TaxID=1343394 RepID=UPI002541DEAE|nr:DNA repair and recombination protein radC [Penicillium maclennaniae]KAJ5665744.1 DNA repair and recombination protein radC [Penicillium maclennaniae]